jgi:NADH dehydrogenase FAD-containing subunit
VPFGLLVWSTGLAPNPLIQSLEGFKKDQRSGGIITDENLNILGEDDVPDKDVWAIGDAAVVEGRVLPATAQGESILIPSFPFVE